MAGQLPVVVALGSVDPALVTGVLDGHCRFVPDPGDADLSLAAGAIARADARVDQALLDKAPALRVVARTGVGVDLVDVAAATARGIAVVITPGGGAAAVAEGAIGMALHLVKRFGPLTALVRDGHCAQRGTVPVGDLGGATLGVIGYGRIGQRTAELGAAFGMRRPAGATGLTPRPAGQPLINEAAPLTRAAGRRRSCLGTPPHEGDPSMTSSADKIAGAPISWGVCEVPGWGYQLPPERVLTEMQQVGLAATEFGPDGFLPADLTVMAELLAARHLTAVGGFTPVVLHEPGHDPLPGIDRLLDSYDASHADVLVLSAATGQDGYDTRPELDESGWKTLLGNLDRLTALAAGRGVRAVLHPHVGTMVERGTEVQRVLEGSAISLCLDTGHLLIAGTDPAELTRQAPDRIAHTHFKDVSDQIAAQVRSGRLTYTEAVGRGMYRPLGSGDVDFAAIVGYLRGRGYDGWYVLEQDTILTEEPRGEGPAADVRHSAGYLRALLTAGR